MVLLMKRIFQSGQYAELLTLIHIMIIFNIARVFIDDLQITENSYSSRSLATKNHKIKENLVATLNFYTIIG
jgi:hypothetical protein